MSENTSNEGSKKPTRKGAAARGRAAAAREAQAADPGLPYTAALKATPAVEGTDTGRYGFLVEQLEQVNAELRTLGRAEADPVRWQDLLDSRAVIWGQLGTAREQHDVYGQACAYAAILDQQDAARVRFAAGVPTLFPQTELALLKLEESVCTTCRRPWQLSRAATCPSCPEIRRGHPAEQPQQVTTPEADPVADDDSLVSDPFAIGPEMTRPQRLARLEKKADDHRRDEKIAVLSEEELLVIAELLDEFNLLVNYQYVHRNQWGILSRQMAMRIFDRLGI